MRLVVERHWESNAFCPTTQHSDLVGNRTRSWRLSVKGAKPKVLAFLIGQRYKPRKGRWKQFLYEASIKTYFNWCWDIHTNCALFIYPRLLLLSRKDHQPVTSHFWSQLDPKSLRITSHSMTMNCSTPLTLWVSQVLSDKLRLRSCLRLNIAD